MRRIVIFYGLIAGVLSTLVLLVLIYTWEKEALSFEFGEYAGYASMLVALSMVFFGIKSFRDNQKSHAINFWKGAQIGLLITLIASFFYATAWEVYLQVNPGFLDEFTSTYTEHHIGRLTQKGASPEEIDQATSTMAQMKELYKNPLSRFLLALVEIIPIGIIVTLVSAAILRRKEVLAE
jgi:hypothetical protein